MPDQIEIISPGDDIMALFQREPLCTVTKAEQVWELLTKDVVNISITSVEPLEIYIGFRTVCLGKTYYLNQMPSAQKFGERKFNYDLVFEGPQYTLRRAQYFNTDVTGFNTTSDFSLTGPAELFLDVLLNNLARVFGPGVYVKGEFPTTGVKTISFNGGNCLSALQTICKEFETEFELVESGGSVTVHLRKVGQILGTIYEYGRGYGLYELKRNTVSESDIITRLYPLGSDKNLKADYRGFSPRLRLADPGYIEDPAAVALYGIREGSKEFDIFPHRTGYVTSASGVTFVDSTMNFDLNEVDGGGNTKWLIAGTPAKIKFNTGNLAGYEFSLKDKTGYVHSTKTFTLLPFTDERGLELPNPTEVAFQIGVGDEYVILDIVLPDSYVETAENELEAQAELFYDSVKYPKVQYGLKPDEMYLKKLAGGGSIVNYYGVGDYVQILDDDLGIDKSSRVIGIRRNVLKPYDYQLTIDDTYQISVLIQIIDKLRDNDKIIKINDLRDPMRAKLGWRTTLEVLSMVFDTDGYFDGGKIRPESIETMMLVVGAKSMQFILQDVIISANFEGQPNVVDVTSGLLIHYALKETILVWTMDASVHTIPDNNARYIYAKVNKTVFTGGQIIFSTSQIKPDDDPTYYHFLVGILNSVMEGVRWINFMYGATAINGRFIKTGRVQSFDGQTFFDLDMSLIGGHIKFIDAEGNYRDLSDIGAATDRFYELTVINDPLTYPAGFITAWFQAANPATWPGGEESAHEGDMWYDTVSGDLSRRIGGAWVLVTDPDTIASYLKQYTRLGAGSNVKMFTATTTPLTPYRDGDLWMSPAGLRRSIATKMAGASDVNDWVEPFNYDNTATAIDGHIVTSGIIQLAGDKNAIWAGVSGQGTTPDSVRFWAGASTENKETAPWRIFQDGRNFSRFLVAVEGVDGSTLSGYAVQAGLVGSEIEGDQGIRIFAGSDEDHTDTAPFRVRGDGKMWADEARIGTNIKVSSGSITNQDENDDFTLEANIIFRLDSENAFVGIGTNIIPATSGNSRGLMRLYNNRVVSGADNIGAIFSASGATASLGTGGDNTAIYVGPGSAILYEVIKNGGREINISPASGTYIEIDPSMYDLINITPASSGTSGVSLKLSGTKYPIKDSAEVNIFGTSDIYGFRIVNTIYGNPNPPIAAGSWVTLGRANGNWQVKSIFDNNW